MIIVELVSTKALKGRLMTSSPYGDQVNGNEEGYFVCFPRFNAQVFVTRFQARYEPGQC